jgi:hypothetical protein
VDLTLKNSLTHAQKIILNFIGATTIATTPLKSFAQRYESNTINIAMILILDCTNAKPEKWKLTEKLYLDRCTKMTQSLALDI